VKIEDYAFLSDTQTAALVGRNGSVDWLCFPRFDSASCFAALIGEPKNGRWLIAPSVDSATVTRKYRGYTLILETTFETKDGAVRLIDFMPPRGTNPDIVRIVEGVRGKVAMRMELIIRFDYGDMVPWVRKCGDGLEAIADRTGSFCERRLKRAEKISRRWRISKWHRVSAYLSCSPGISHTNARRARSIPKTRCARRKSIGAIGPGAASMAANGAMPLCARWWSSKV
jgi:GH15 family glucan-1,4-alpha-glucosidase